MRDETDSRPAARELVTRLIERVDRDRHLGFERRPVAVADGQETVLDPPWPVHVDDLSADGLKLRTTEELAVGAHVRTAIPLQGRSLEVQLEVVRRTEVRGALTYGCRILGVSERDRDALFRFVLEQQRRTLAQRASRR